MRLVEIDELRQIQLGILSQIDDYCKEHGLVYSFAGGSLLGAVRHKGYIPWDDDIDLMMPRNDYERFAREFSAPGLELLDLRKDGNTVEIMLKVVRKGTVMTDVTYGRSLWGINVDVFPIDGAPLDYETHYSNVMKLRDRLPRICPFYKVVPKKKAVWFAKYILKRLRYGFRGSVVSVKKEIEDLVCSYPLETSPKAGIVLGSYGSWEIMDKHVFDEMTELPFEGRMYPSIKDYDTYLKATYGDYMKLPPVEKRVTHHLYDSYIL